MASVAYFRSFPAWMHYLFGFMYKLYCMSWNVLHKSTTENFVSFLRKVNSLSVGLFAHTKLYLEPADQPSKCRYVNVAITCNNSGSLPFIEYLHAAGVFIDVFFGSLVT
jgi:hypothetical protein